MEELKRLQVCVDLLTEYHKEILKITDGPVIECLVGMRLDLMGVSNELDRLNTELRDSIGREYRDPRHEMGQ